MPPEMWTLRLTRGAAGGLRFELRPREEQIELLAFDQVRGAEEDEELKMMLSCMARTRLF